MSDKLLDFGATGGGGGGITEDVKWVESRYFIKVSDVIKPVGKDEPTLSSIESYVNSKSLANLIAYWNGTDDPNQGVVSAYYIDKDGNVTQLDHPNTIDTNVLEKYKSYNGDAHLSYRELAYVHSDSGVRAFLPSPSGGKTGMWCAIQFSGDGYILANGLKITDGQVAMFILIDGTWRNLYPLQKVSLPLNEFNSVTGNTLMLAKHVYSCAPSPSQTLKMFIPAVGEVGDMVVAKNDGAGKVQVCVPSVGIFPEVIIDELEPKEVSYLVYLAGNWQRITPHQIRDNTLKVVSYSANATIKNNEYAIVKGGNRYTIDQNAPDGTRWKLMNSIGANSQFLFQIGGINIESVLYRDVIDIVKVDGEIKYSLKGKGLRVKALTSLFTIPPSSRITMYRCTAQNTDLIVTLPSAWSTWKTFTVVNEGNKRKGNVIVKDPTSGKTHFVPEGDGSITFNSNANGAWAIINSHLHVDQRVKSVDPFGFPFATKELFVSDFSLSGNGKSIYNIDDVLPYHVNGFEGVDMSSMRMKRAEKRYGISNISLDRKSFVFSFWVRVDYSRGGTNEVYILGNSNSGASNQAIHIGWRDRRRITLAFYGNDVNWTVPARYYADSIVGKNKWVHLAFQHNTVTKKSRLWINGSDKGEKTHPNGRYRSDVSQLFGARNVAKLAGFISNLRIFVTGGYNSISYDCSRFYELEKHYFRGTIA